MVSGLVASGIRRGILIKGATQAAHAGIHDTRGDLRPEARVDAIKEMQKRYEATGMTGDGINGAPALVQADIGFSMQGRYMPSFPNRVNSQKSRAKPKQKPQKKSPHL